nr:hypothetical protein [Candidatus Freyarchaeota archaeon]
MIQKTNDSESRNPGVDAGTTAVIDVEQLQTLTKKYLGEMVNKVSAMFPMRGLKEVLRFQCNEFASNLFRAILTVLEKKEEEAGEEKEKNKIYQELKKQLRNTLKKMVENIEKWGKPLGEKEHEEETSIETVAPISQKVAEKLIVGGVKAEQKQSFPELKEKGEDAVMKEESQKLIKSLGEQREKYSPFIYSSGEEEIIHLRGQVEGLTRIIDRIKPLVETDPRYKVIVLIGSREKITTEELGDSLGLTAGKLSRLLKELRKLEMIDVNENGEIVLKPRKSEEETQ